MMEPHLEGSWHFTSSLCATAWVLGAWERQMEMEGSFPGATTVPHAEVIMHVSASVDLTVRVPVFIHQTTRASEAEASSSRSVF